MKQETGYWAARSEHWANAIRMWSPVAIIALVLTIASVIEGWPIGFPVLLLAIAVTWLAVYALLLQHAIARTPKEDRQPQRWCPRPGMSW